MSDSLSWSLGAISLTALSIVLTRNAGSLGSVVAIGGATLAATGSLWWLWRREQSVQPSPMSEYLAVAYGWAYYTSLVFIWESVGDRWVDWLVILPPNFFRASDRQKARPHVCTSISHIRSHRVRRSPSRCGRLHRRCSVPGPHRALAAVVAPVPLIAAALHPVASRFYARRGGTPTGSTGVPFH